MILFLLLAIAVVPVPRLGAGTLVAAVVARP
jgi:hypothetical protein